MVVLPLVPVIPMQRVPRRATNPTSTSAKMPRPAARAAASGGTSGGTPGATTTAAARPIRARSWPPSSTSAPISRNAAAHASCAGPTPLSDA